MRKNVGVADSLFGEEGNFGWARGRPGKNKSTVPKGGDRTSVGTLKSLAPAVSGEGWGGELWTQSRGKKKKKVRE